MSYGEPERLPQPWSLDAKASRPLIRQALEAGINFFDTANIYSGGSSDAFALKMYENAALLDKPVIDVVASIAEKHDVPRAHVAIAWLLSKTVITAPIIGATKPEHLSTAISALDFSLSDAEIMELEARYLPHPVDGIIPPLPDMPPSLTPPSAIQDC